MFYSFKKKLYEFIDSDEKKNVLQRRFIILIIDALILLLAVFISLKITGELPNPENGYYNRWLFSYVAFIGLITYVH